MSVEGCISYEEVHKRFCNLEYGAIQSLFAHASLQLNGEFSSSGSSFHCLQHGTAI